MDSRWRTWASYRRVPTVGSSPSQYQWKVSSVTNFAHVLSSNLVLLKIFSKKLHSSRETYGWSWTVKKTVSNILIKNYWLNMDRFHTRRGQYAPCFFNGHILSVTRTIHPFVPFHEKILTLPIPVGVGSLTHEPQQRAPRHKNIHVFWLSNLLDGNNERILSPSASVLRQTWPRTRPPGIWGDLGDGQT